MQELYRTELEYLKCFSQCYEDSTIMRFRDNMIDDMYSHNVTYIKREISDAEFRKLIASEIAHSTSIGKNFLTVQFDFPFRPSMVQELDNQPSEITIFDYYLFQNGHFENLASRKDCTLRRLDSSLLKHALELDLHTNGEGNGRDFVKRRFERRSKVYLLDGLVDNYICFHGSDAVGHCDMFLNGNVAKIEDVDVAPDQQRKGYGTAMLKEMIRIAMSKGAETIYLVTDHDDTAKDMYEKCGFVGVAKKTALLFKI